MPDESIQSFWKRNLGWLLGVCGEERGVLRLDSGSPLTLHFAFRLSGARILVTASFSGQAQNPCAIRSFIYHWSFVIVGSYPLNMVSRQDVLSR